jgi:peroxiredoxin Q/BCP
MAQTARKSKTKTKAKLTKKKAKLPKRKTAAKKAAKKVAKKATKKVAKKTKAKTKAPVRKTVAKLAVKRAAISAKPLIATVTAPIAQAPRVAAGDMAPDFSLTNQLGETVTLSALRGKKVVVYFYPKDDTPGCTKEACSFRDHTEDFIGQEATILGISFDDSASHQKFIDKYQLNFSLLTDATKETAQAYGVYVEKNMYGNISWGIERSTFIIDREGKIVAAFRRVSVDGHTQEVLEALKTIA